MGWMVTKSFILLYYTSIDRGERMRFILWFEWEAEKTSKLMELWKNFEYPKEVELIDRYLLIGRHLSLAILDAPSEKSILEITYPFRDLGVPHVAPALPLEEALEMMEKM